MADGNSRPNYPVKERARFALNDFRYRLTGKRLEGAARACAIGFDLNREGLRIMAFTNVEGDEDHGMIRAEVSLPDAFFIITKLEQAPRLAPGASEDIAIAGSEYNRQTNKRETRHQATLRIGRTDTGVIYLEMRSWKATRPVVHVPMLPSNFLKLVDSSGTPAPADKVSADMAVSWARNLSIMAPLALTTEYTRIMGDSQAKKPGQGQGGNQGGQGGQQYGNRGGNQGGGYDAPKSAFDFGDDLPFN